VEVAHQQPGFPVGKAERFRFIGIVKIIDIEPVRRFLLSEGDLAQQVVDDRRPAGAPEAGDEEVIGRIVHGQAEVDGADRPVLSDHRIERLDILGGFKFIA
jgi:hypothetical protein